MSVICRYNRYTICFAAFLALSFTAGCGDYDNAGANSTVTPPTVSAVAPPNGTPAACPNSIVTATFSKAMNPSLI